MSGSLNLTTRPALQPRLRLSIAAAALAALALALVCVWAYRFLTIIDYGDLLYQERLLIFGLTMVHLAAWIQPPQRSITAPKCALLAATCLIGLGGVCLSKTSVISMSFVVFIWAIASLFTPRRDYRTPILMIGVMLVLLCPYWLVRLPSDWSLQATAIRVGLWMIQWFEPTARSLGTIITVGGGTMTITTSCDGSSFLHLNLAVAVYCSLYTRSWFLTALRIIAAASLAVVLNWVRIAVLGWLLGAGYEEFAFHSGHALIGHVTFCLGMMPIVWFSKVPEKWNEFFDLALARVQTRHAAR